MCDASEEQFKTFSCESFKFPLDYENSSNETDYYYESDKKDLKKMMNCENNYKDFDKKSIVIKEEMIISPKHLKAAIVTEQQNNYYLKLNQINDEDRINDLQKAIETLSKGIFEEKQFWHNAVDEFLNKNDFLSRNYLNFTAEKKSFLNYYSNDNNYQQTMILGYQEAITAARIEKRLTLKRQLAVNEYKKRLMEIENMCNQELLKLKNNLQNLEPLNKFCQQLLLPPILDNSGGGDFNYQNTKN